MDHLKNINGTVCPKCQGSLQLHGEGYHVNGDLIYKVVCASCGAESHTAFTPEWALKNFVHRHVSDEERTERVKEAMAKAYANLAMEEMQMPNATDEGRGIPRPSPSDCSTGGDA